MPDIEGNLTNTQEKRDLYWETVSPEKMEKFIFSKTGRKLSAKYATRALQSLKVKHVFDIGCGYSKILEYFEEVEYYPRYEGFEPVQKMVDYNNEHWASGNNTFKCARADEVEGRADAALFLNIFGSFEKQEALDTLALGFEMADIVVTTNLDSERYAKVDKSYRKAHFNSLSVEDYESIKPEGWSMSTETLGRKHRGVTYIKETK